MAKIISKLQILTNAWYVPSTAVHVSLFSEAWKIQKSKSYCSEPCPAFRPAAVLAFLFICSGHVQNWAERTQQKTARVANNLWEAATSHQSWKKTQLTLLDNQLHVDGSIYIWIIQTLKESSHLIESDTIQINLIRYRFSRHQLNMIYMYITLTNIQWKPRPKVNQIRSLGASRTREQKKTCCLRN